jgi:hypothetical protein
LSEQQKPSVQKAVASIAEWLQLIKHHVLACKFFFIVFFLVSSFMMCEGLCYGIINATQRARKVHHKKLKSSLIAAWLQ